MEQEHFYIFSGISCLCKTVIAQGIDLHIYPIGAR
jgi:hypothetical protein